MYTKWAADEIRIEKLEVFAYHGVYPEETRNGQIFYVNAVLYTDVHRAAAADDLESTVNYGEVCRFIGDWMAANTVNGQYNISTATECLQTPVNFWRRRRRGWRRLYC